MLELGMLVGSPRQVLTLKLVSGGEIIYKVVNLPQKWPTFWQFLTNRAVFTSFPL